MAAFEFCCEEPENIENYELALADKENVWHIHHKLEMFFTSNQLKKMKRYYQVPARELIFLSPSEHCGNPLLHVAVRKRSEEHKKKISEKMRDRPRKKFFYRTYINERGEFESQIDVFIDPPSEEWKPLTVETLEKCHRFRYL